MMNFTHYIQCVDVSTGGEPTRIVTSGFPPIPGDTILKKRQYVLDHLDNYRKLIMFEPRGHSGMYGAILCDKVTPDADFSVLFTHNEGLSSMCGHATIAIAKTAVEMGWVPHHEGRNVIKLDAPAGRITAFVEVKNDEVQHVSFQNVPCFLYEPDVKVDVDGYGEITGDIAYGGAFYVYVDASQLGMKVEPDHADDFVKIGTEIKEKVAATHTFNHPTNPGINWLYGTIFYDPITEGDDGKAYTRNVCIFAEGQIDRSPTGTGTGGRVALHYAKGELKKDQILVNDSIINTPMEGKIISETTEGKYPAVITEVSGNAHITGFNNLVLDPKDPLPEGFRITGN